jgi:hypothetical protein
VPPPPAAGPGRRPAGPLGCLDSRPLLLYSEAMRICRPTPVCRRCAPTRRWAAGLVAATLALAPPVWALDPSQTIRGTVELAPDLAARPGAGDRLIIKLYHPGAGVDLDAKYRIIEEFTLPLDFVAAPSIDMSGRTKFQAYVVEVFTDTDGDAARAAPGELVARTPAPVPLGTTGLRLELEPAPE